MIEGRTSTGFNFKIDEEIRDDMELLEGLMQIDKGNVSGLADVLVQILGEEQKKDLYEHNRKENGRVSASAVIADLMEIIKQAGGDVKK